MRYAIWAALRGRKSGRSWEELAGYSVEALATHIARQFLPGMGWQNIGDWHVDHIVPLANFTYQSSSDPEFRAAWALTNLRPLWKRDNLMKGPKRLHLI